MNTTYLGYIDLGYNPPDSYNATISLTRLYCPEFKHVEKDIEFSDARFYLEVKELPPGIEFYETIEEADELY